MYVYVEKKGAYKEFDIVWRQISKRNLEHKYSEPTAGELIGLGVNMLLLFS